MKIKLAVLFSVVAAILCLSAVSFSADADQKLINGESVLQSDVITVSVADSGAVASEVLKSRFLNMLNHSFVYDGAFKSAESVVNCSMPALLDMRESEDDSYIAENIVSAYIYDMYGVVVEDYSEINSAFEQKKGYVYIIPRGFSVYTHEMISAVMNEDGSYTVKTKVLIDSHDNAFESFECTTLFVANPDSQFGYNIISSAIASGEILA